MNGITSREGLIQELDRRQAELISLVESLNEDQLRMPLFQVDPGIEQWTVSDALYHLAAWKRNGASAGRLLIEADLEDTFPAQLLGIAVKEFNRELLGDGPRDRNALLAELTSAHGELLSVVTEVPEDRIWAQPGQPRRWLTPGLGHMDVHRDQIIATLG